MYPLLLFLAAPLLSGGSAAATATATDDAQAPDPEATRCRNVRELGSRIPKRVCKTNLQWEREAAEARARMDNRNRSSHCSERC